MAKTKTAKGPTLPTRVVTKLIEAQQYLIKKQPDQALPILLELDRESPNRYETLILLSDAYFDLQDAFQYEHVLRRLAKIAPNNADIGASIGGALLINMRPILAYRAYENFLRRWPNDPRVKDMREAMDRIQPTVAEQVLQTGLPKDEALDQLEQHEEVRYFLEHGEYVQGRRAAEKLLKRYPDFVPAMNNLSQILSMTGSTEDAIRMARRALEKDPENLHARANLVRMLFLSGHFDEARAEGERLKTIPPVAPDRWAKLAEAFSVLGDHQAVLSLVDQAKKEKELEPPFLDAFFYHLAGAAAMHLRREKDARRFWEKALEINPNFTWAAQNLDDLDQPPAERSGPWAFPLSQWLLGETARGLQDLIAKQKIFKDKKKLEEAGRQFLDQHPEMIALVPHLLERGSSDARDFVFNLAALLTGAPEVAEPAKAFIFGRAGSTDLRLRGAHTLSEANLLPSGMIKLWNGSQQQEYLMVNFEITNQTDTDKLSKDARSLATRAYEAAGQDNPVLAVELLEKAIELQPDAPSLHYNLASALDQQGKTEASDEMMRKIHERFPDYLFGITEAAGLAIRERDFKQAREMLNGLMTRQKLHVSEFTALAAANMELGLAEGQPDVARSWLALLEKVAPDSPVVSAYRGMIETKK